MVKEVWMDDIDTASSSSNYLSQYTGWYDEYAGGFDEGVSSFELIMKKENKVVCSYAFSFDLFVPQPGDGDGE